MKKRCHFSGMSTREELDTLVRMKANSYTQISQRQNSDACIESDDIKSVQSSIVQNEKETLGRNKPKHNDDIVTSKDSDGPQRTVPTQGKKKGCDPR